MSDIHRELSQEIDHANGLIMKGQFAEAGLSLVLTLAKASRPDLLHFQLSCLISLSALSLNLRNYQEAENILVQAIPIAEKINERSGLARCLMNLGSIRRRHSAREALDLYERALQIFQELRETLGAGQCLDNIATLYRQSGHLRRAALFCSMAATQFQEAGDLSALARNKSFEGDIYSTMAAMKLEPGERMYPLAAGAYVEAMMLFSKISEPLGAMQCLTDLAGLERLQGNFENSEHMQHTALQQLASIGHPYAIPEIYCNLGHLYMDMKEYPKAIQHYERYANLTKAAEGSSSAGRVGTFLAFAYCAFDQFQKAADLLQDALPLLEQGEARTIISKIEPTAYYFTARAWRTYLYALARVCVESNDNTAISALRSALDQSRTPSSQLSFGEADNEDLAAESVRSMVSYREELIRIGHKRRLIHNRHAMNLLTDEERGEQMEMAILANTQYATRLNQEESRWIGNQIRNDEADYSCLLAAKGLTDSAVVWLVDFPLKETEEIGIGIITTAGSTFELVPFPFDERETVMRAVHNLQRGAIYDRIDVQRHESSLQKLSKILGDTLQKSETFRQLLETRIDKITIIPHGSLHHLPWEVAAVKTSELGLVKGIQRALSGSHFQDALRHDPKGFGNAGKALIVIPEAILPCAYKESEEVRRSLEELGMEIVILEGEAVDKLPSVLRQGSFDLIHFSGHSTFNHSDPMLSSLLLHENKLTALEIATRTRLHRTSLIYLSSCASGAAEIHMSDEQSGLPSAMVASGAGGLVLSGWPVFDESAADISKGFYSSYMKQTLPIEALRLARSEVDEKAARGEYSDGGRLVHWAPFRYIMGS